MDYFASKNTTLGVVFSGFLNDRNADNNNLTYISDANGKPASQSKATLTNVQEWKNFSTNVNFRQGLDTMGSELTADLDYSQYNSRNNPIMINSYFDEWGSPTFAADTLLGGLPQDIKIYAARVDYTKMLKKRSKVRSGYQIEYCRDR